MLGEGVSLPSHFGTPYFGEVAGGENTIGLAEITPLPSCTVMNWLGFRSGTKSFFPLGQTISRLTVLSPSGLPSPKVTGSSLCER